MRREDVPTDQPFVSNMEEAAIALHEVYTSYLRAGFSKDHAFKLVTHQLTLAHECPNHTAPE